MLLSSAVFDFILIYTHFEDVLKKTLVEVMSYFTRYSYKAIQYLKCEMTISLSWEHYGVFLGTTSPYFTKTRSFGRNITFTQIKDDPLTKTKPFLKKHIPVFSRLCSLALAAPSVTVMLPHIVVVGAVNCVQNATLLKRPDDRIMGSLCSRKSPIVELSCQLCFPPPSSPGAPHLVLQTLLQTLRSAKVDESGAQILQSWISLWAF